MRSLSPLLLLLLTGCMAQPLRPSLQSRTPQPIPLEAPARVAAAPLPEAAAPSEAVFPPVDDGRDVPERAIDARTAPDEVLARIGRADGSVVRVNRAGAGGQCRIQFVSGGVTGLRANPIECLDAGFASVRSFRIVGRDVVVVDGDGRDVARLALGGGFFAWAPSELAPRALPGR